MICKPRIAAAALALALMLMPAGCAQADPPARTHSVDPDIARLVRDAGAATGRGDPAAARSIIAEGLRAHPESPDLQVALARLQFLAGEQLAALASADRALALDRSSAPALLMRALMVRDAHGPAFALPWFKAALEADGKSADAWAEYAATLGEAGRNREMLEALRELAAIDPADRRALYLQAVLAARAQDHALARNLLSRSGMAEAGVPAAMMLDAVTNLEEGNHDSAADTLIALEQRQPANARVRELLARALFLAGRYEELAARFADDAARPDASPYLLTILARGYERAGDRAQAAPLLARARQFAAGAPVPLADLAGLPEATSQLRRMAQAGNGNGAGAAAAALKQRFPLSSDAAALAGDAPFGASDWAGALADYTRAATVRRPWPLTRKVAYAYNKGGDATAAQALLRRHVAGEPGALSAVVTLAEGEAAAGHWGSVAALLDHAIDHGAGHDPDILALRLKAARALGDAGGAKRFALLLASVRPPPLAAR